MSELQLAGIDKKNGVNHILRKVSFKTGQYKRVVIAGETGSGKSTLLKIIAGLEQSDKGSVMFDGERIKGPNETLVAGHPKIAYLSQLFELPKFLRVEQVLDYANKLTEREATKLFKLCEINHLTGRKTDELSGGERQRVALARQLISSPKLLLLDEPYSNLDIIHKNSLRKVIDDIVKATDITCLLVSHDPLDILPWAEQVLVLQKGMLLQSGTAEQVYKRPVNEYVAALLGKYNKLSPHLKRKFKLGSQKELTYLRPECLLVHKRPVSHCMEAEVEKIMFCGSYQELYLNTGSDLLVAYVKEYAGKTGDRIFVSVKI